MKRYFQFLGIIVILLIVGYVFLVNTVMPKYIRQMLPKIESLAPEYINGSISIGNLVWNGGLSAEFTDITVKDSTNNTITELPRVIIHFKPWLAVNSTERTVSRIELIRPHVYLKMDDKQQWNMQHLLKASDSEETPFYGLLEINDGKLDVEMPQGEWEFTVDGTVSGNANPNFAVDLQVVNGVDTVKAKGLLNIKGQGQVQFNSDKLDLRTYASLVKHYAAIDKFDGSIDNLALMYINKQDGLHFSGDISLKDLSGEFKIAGQNHSIKLNGAVKAVDNIIKVKDFLTVIDEQKLIISAETNLKNLDEIIGEGLITSENLTFKDYQISNLQLPFKFDKDNIILESILAEYGEGNIIANGNISLAEKKAACDISLININHIIDEQKKNIINGSGKIALLADFSSENVKITAATDMLDLGWRDVRVNKITLDGLFNNGNLIINNFSAFSGKNGNLAAKGVVSADGSLDIKGRMADFPIDPLLNVVSEGSRGLCSTEFTLEGNISTPEFAGIIQLSAVEFMHQKIKEAHGLISLKDNLLNIKDFSANMDQGSHLINGSVDFKAEDPYFDLNLKTSGVRIEPLMKFIDTGIEVTGNLWNEMTFKGTIHQPNIIGRVYASDGSAVKQLFNSVDGNYSYIDNTLYLRDFEVNAVVAKVKLDGKMSPDKSLDFVMDAKDVDLAHLPIKDETVDLDGLLNASGHLGGSLTKPYFTGNVLSDSLCINGERLIEVQGTLDSNAKDKNLFNVSFKQPYRDDPINYGIYNADINLDLVDNFIKGNVSMIWGDIGGLLRMARLDYDINGLMQGELTFNPHGKGSGAFISVDADDVKIHEQNYAHMNFRGSLKKGILSLDDVKLQEQKDILDKGIIAAQGSINFTDKTLNLELASAKANPAVVTAVMKDPPEIKGEMDLLVQLNGTFDNPIGTASILVNNGSVAGVGVDSLTAMFFLKDDNIKLQQLIANKDAYSVKADGDIPLDLFRSKANRRNANAQMNIIMDLDEARLGILPAMTDLVEWGIGDTKGKIRLAGTLEEPLLFGSVKVADGSIKVKNLDTVLENINLDVDFQGSKILLRNLSTKLGKGNLIAEGSYVLQTSKDDAYRLNIKAKDVDLASTIFTGRINSELEIVPQKYRDYRNYNGTEPPEQYRPTVKGNLRLDDVKVNMPTIPEFGEGESNIGFDLKVDLGPKIHLYNSYLYDIWLSGGIHLNGSTLYPIIDGSIKAEKGAIKYLRTDFKINKASLVWVEPGTFLPNVNLDSTARFSRYNIFMRINGPVTEMDLQLSSNPPLDKNTIVRMLTLQRESGGSNEVTNEDLTNLMTAGLQMTVLGDVEMLVKQTLGVDQFRIYTGKVRSGIGFEGIKDRNHELTDDERNQYNILISKYLNDKIMIGYTTSFDGVDRSIFGQYDISRHLNITYSRSYDISDKAENWYGLEYKVTF